MNILNIFKVMQVEKNQTMIETRRLKNVVNFFKTIFSFVLPRKIIPEYCYRYGSGNFSVNLIAFRILFLLLSKCTCV